MLKPATPRHPEHDSACPWCGEPFKAARVLGNKCGVYNCGRCNGGFFLLREKVYTADGTKPLTPWVGDPL